MKKMFFLAIVLILGVLIVGTVSAEDVLDPGISTQNMETTLVTPGGQSGTTLQDQYITGTAYWETPYTWTINKTGPTTGFTLKIGETTTGSYNVRIQNTEGTTTAYIKGVIYEKNGGDVATENLKITYDVQTKDAAGPWYTISTANSVDVSSNPILDPNEGGTYNYQYNIPEEYRDPGREFRVIAHVTITNHSGHLGDEWGPTFSTPHPETDPQPTLPASPTLIDETVTVSDDKYGSLGTFTVGQNIDANGYVDIPYSITIGPYSAPGDYIFKNTANFETTDTHTTGSDSWEVPVWVQSSCGTYTIGYWKTHAGFTGNNPDVVSSKLPILLGTPGGTKSVNVTNANQAVTLLSMSGDASNGINKLYAQLLAAKLNQANGATVPDTVNNVITNADNFLAKYNNEDWNSLTKNQKQQVLIWMNNLDQYNNGLL